MSDKEILLSLNDELSSIQQELNARGDGDHLSSPSDIVFQSSRSVAHLRQSLILLLRQGNQLMVNLLSQVKALNADRSSADCVHEKKMDLFSVSQEFRAWIDRYLLVYSTVAALEEESIKASFGIVNEETESILPLAQTMLAEHRSSLHAIEKSLSSASQSLKTAVEAWNLSSNSHHAHSHSHSHSHSHYDEESGEDLDDPHKITQRSWILYSIGAIFILYAIFEFVIL